MNIGQKLKKMRVENNMTMLELSAIFKKKYNAKTNITTISRLEHNKLSANNKYLGYYADYFGVSYEWLQNGEQARHIVKNATIQSLMTYEKFKKEVEKLGLYFWILDEIIKVGIVKNTNTDVLDVCNDELEELCSIYTKKRFSFYQNHRFYKLDEVLQEELFCLIIKLAQTPIDNRGDLYEVKKWYLKHKYMNTWGGGNYLIDRGGTAGLSLGHKTSNTLIKYTFTDHDIEELKKKINLNDFEMEEVE